jgi:hypothetical protein
VAGRAGIGAELREALGLAPSDRVALVAVRDRAGGAPIYAGAAPYADSEAAAAPLQIVVQGDVVTLCGATLPALAHASVKKPAELDAAFGQLAAACRAKHCDDAIVIDEDDATQVPTIVGLLDRARAAGFTRAAIGGPTTCDAP